MNNTISIYDAKTNLSKYIKQAKAGTPVYIGSYGNREVVLMAIEPKKTQITFGAAKGKLEFRDKQQTGLDPEVQEMFYGKDWDKS